MKKLIIILLLCINFCSQVFADPADPTPRKVIQPNGDSIWVSLHGDEYGSWYEDDKGNIIDRNNDGYWVYVSVENNNKVLTNQIVSQISMPIDINRDSVFNFVLQKRVNNYIEQKEISEGQVNSRTTTGELAPLPAIGVQKILTVLVQFTDVKFQNQTGIKNLVTNMMNQSNYRHPGQNNITGSLRDFYLRASYNQLDVRTTVIGPYTVSHNMAYYGASTGTLKDKRRQELAEEVMNMIVGDIDVSQFDNNGDGWVECIHILFAGYAQNDSWGYGNDDAIWPHQGSLATSVSGDGVNMSRYIMTPELNGPYYRGVGTICHELGHIFGAPDFYDVENNTFKGTGKFDLMCGGNWNGLIAATYPAHPNPYVKTEIFGWTTATELSGTNRTYILRPSEKVGNGIYKLSTSTPDEYYLLENRQDTHLPGTGLVIYHVHSDISSSNINVGHPQKMYVVDASNNLPKPTGSVASYGTINSSNATFRQTESENIFFTSTSKPSNSDWAGNVTENKDVCFIWEVLENGEKRIKFTLNPTIEGPDILCDSAIYSVANVPAGATIEWGYEPDSIPTMSTPFVIGEGQGTSSVWFKRGEKRTISSGVEPEPGIPVRPTPTSVVPNSQTLVIEPYRGVGRLYAKISSGNNTYRISKDVCMPQDMKIADTEYGTADNPLRPNRSYDFSLRHPVASAWESNVRWTISDMHGSRTATGNSVWVSTGNSIAVSLRVEFVGGCSDTGSDSKIFQVVSNVGLMFTNPATDFAEINVVGAEEYDSDVRTMSLNTNTSYMGTYRLELWHDVYGKVREMDVAENTPSVTMNLAGLNSGIYVLRLIIDNQVVETSQMIIR